MNETEKIIWPGWETGRLIGRGSFGAVYEIQRQMFDEVEKAALKVISIPQSASDVAELYSDGYDADSITETFRAHLKSIVSEYSLMRKMNGSSNIVNCDDVRYIQHDDGIGWDIFIKMELLTPLTETLTNSISDSTVIRIAQDICEALVLCNKHGIVHRDIKPQNIFVSPNGDYKLGDFGIAKTVEKTMGGTKIGTYKYMAPEVYNNQPYGSAADIYSLGLVLYWLLNERRMPFMPLPPAKLKAGQDEEARHRRLSGEELPAPAHGSDELKRIVLKACAYDHNARYASATAMLEDLNKLAGTAENTSSVIIPSENEDEKPEENKTTGPVFGGVKKDISKDSVETDSDVTVGPSFVVKKPAVEEIEEEIEVTPTPANVDVNDTKEKKSILKYVLVAIGIVVAIILFLLLRSCGGDKPIDDPSQGATNTQSTEGSTATTEQLVWSDWLDNLPEGITADKYEIEEKTLYSSRTQETTSSTEKNSMDGWELYDTVEANGEFGPWSDWSATKVETSATREVDTQTRYRYRDKETTTSSSSTKDGWTKYDTTYSWGNYGSWSSWSTTSASNSDSRKVETKTQYRYRNISYSTEYTSWGSWSSWSFDRQSTSDLKKEDSRYVYGYYYYTCPNCGAHMHGWNMYCPTWAGGCGKGWIAENMWTQVYSTTSWDAAGLKDWHGTGKYYAYVDGQLVFKWTSGGSGTQYRYATRSTQQVANYGSWSSWGDTAYSNSSTREVQTRTVYRYCDRSQVATYHFYRWGNWSNWSADKVSATNDRQVENTTYYRYRDQAKTTTYFFRRWTEWSAYSETATTPTETVEVQTKTQYRYKSKGN